MKKMKYDLRVYRTGRDAVPYAHIVAVDGVKRINFVEDGNLEKIETDEEGLEALLNKLSSFVKEDGSNEYSMNLKISEQKN